MPDILVPANRPPTEANGQPLLERWVEVNPGEYARQVRVISTSVAPPNAALATLFTSATNLAAGGSEQSAFLDISAVANLHLMRTATGGTYALEVDWSRDGVAVDIVETVVVANNTVVSRPGPARFARFRVRNTDGVTAFTAHRTVVSGR